MEAWLLGRQGRKQGYNLLASVKPLCLLHTMVMALDTLSMIDCVSRLKHKERNLMETKLYATICAECQGIPLPHEPMLCILTN